MYKNFIKETKGWVRKDCGQGSIKAGMHEMSLKPEKITSVLF